MAAALSRSFIPRSGISRGFTIVELLIVIVVIAILAAVTLVAYTGFQDRAETAVLTSDLAQASKQLSMDKALSDVFPNTVNADGSGTANGGKGLSTSSGVSYEYTSTGTTFCLSAKRGTKAYHVTEGSTPQEGVCSGHSGPIAGGGFACATGYIHVPGNSSFGTGDFCVMKYEAKNVSGVATSQASGTPWVSISQTTAISTANAACGSCHLTTEAEWMTIAANVLGVASNWSGGSVGSGYIYSGHNDNTPANSLAASSNDSDGYEGTGNSSGNQRRTLTLSNGEVIWDFAGNVQEWTNATIAGGQQPGLSGESAYAWKQWNNGSLQWNGLPASSRPSAISGAVAGYSSTQGVGQLYSNAGEAGARAFLRGGTWGYGSSAGVLALNLGFAPSYSSTYIGFRVAR